MSAKDQRVRLKGQWSKALHNWANHLERLFYWGPRQAQTFTTHVCSEARTLKAKSGDDSLDACRNTLLLLAISRGSLLPVASLG